MAPTRPRFCRACQSAHSWFYDQPHADALRWVKDYEAFAHEILGVITDRPISFDVFADEFCEMERQAQDRALGR